MCDRSKENEKKTKSHETLKNTPRNISTAAQRPRPPRGGVQVNTSHSVAHTRTPPPWMSRLWKSASRVYTHTHILAMLLLLHRLCTFWCSIQFFGQRSFVVLCCDNRMYRRFRGCPVVLDTELSVSAWITRLDVYCCSRRFFCCCFLQQRAKSGGLRCAA